MGGGAQVKVDKYQLTVTDITSSIMCSAMR